MPASWRPTLPNCSAGCSTAGAPGSWPRRSPCQTCAGKPLQPFVRKRCRRSVRPKPVGGDLDYANALERQIAGYWADLLGIAVVRPQDDFFELGGFSLAGSAVVCPDPQESRRGSADRHPVSCIDPAPISDSGRRNGRAGTHGRGCRRGRRAGQGAGHAVRRLVAFGGDLPGRAHPCPDLLHPWRPGQRPQLREAEPAPRPGPALLWIAGARCRWAARAAGIHRGDGGVLHRGHPRGRCARSLPDRGLFRWRGDRLRGRAATDARGLFHRAPGPLRHSVDHQRRAASQHGRAALGGPPLEPRLHAGMAVPPDRAPPPRRGIRAGALRPERPDPRHVPRAVHHERLSRRAEPLHARALCREHAAVPLDGCVCPLSPRRPGSRLGRSRPGGDRHPQDRGDARDAVPGARRRQARRHPPAAGSTA